MAKRLESDDEALPSTPEAEGIGSLETGMKVLFALVRLGGRGQMLSAIAEEAGMSPSKVHRYLTSLVRTEMVERDQKRGQYRLGPAALEVGAKAMGAVDGVRSSMEVLADLRDELNLTIALTVWGSRGPIIVHAEESNQVAAVSFRVGRELPILTSASGICLSAHLPWAVVEQAIRAEVDAAKDRRSTESTVSKFRREIEAVRSRGISLIEGTVTPGMTTLCAPVLDLHGHAVAAIAVTGPTGTYESGLGERTAVTLRRRCAQVSAQLGYK